MIKVEDILSFQKRKAIQSYAETPKTVTAVTHANESDDSEFHCVWRGYNREGLTENNDEGWPYSVRKLFTVPRQKIELIIDPVYGTFYVIRVIPQFLIPSYEGKELCLVSQTNGRSGFLSPLEAVNELMRDALQAKEQLTA